MCMDEDWSLEELLNEKVIAWLEPDYPNSGSKQLLGGLCKLLEYLKDKFGVSRNCTTEEFKQLREASAMEWRNELKKEEIKKKGKGGNISIVGAGSNQAVRFLLYVLMTVKTPVIETGITIKLFEPRDERKEIMKKNLKKMTVVESHLNIYIIYDLLDVFINCDLIIYLGEKFRKPGMDIEKFMYLEKVLYGCYGFLSSFFMEEQTKVVFACMENATFNAQCFLAEGPTIDKKKVVVCTSYLATEVKLYISEVAGFPVESIDYIPVWGMADTCHLVDVDMGRLLFRVPDMSNPRFPNIKALAGHIEDKGVRAKLYKEWKSEEDARVEEWKLSKKKEKCLKENEEIKNKEEVDAALKLMAEQMEEMERRTGQRPYWDQWDRMVKNFLRTTDDFYSHKNIFKRFKKGYFCIVQDKYFVDKVKEKRKIEIEKKLEELDGKAIAVLNEIDPAGKLGLDLEDMKQIIREDFELIEKEKEKNEFELPFVMKNHIPKEFENKEAQEESSTEHISQHEFNLNETNEDDWSGHEESTMLESLEQISNSFQVKKESFPYAVTLKEKIIQQKAKLIQHFLLCWKKYMVKHISWFEEELKKFNEISTRKKGKVVDKDSNERMDENLNEDIADENINEDEFVTEQLAKEEYKPEEYLGNKSEMEESLEQSILEETINEAESFFEQVLTEEEVSIKKLMKDFYKYKMLLEREQLQELNHDSEDSDENMEYEEVDCYEPRELSYITVSLKHLWNFIGVCKHAVRKKIGQDPYIAQVTELIKMMRIWFLDPFMTDYWMFLGISSEEEVYPFLTETVMSQPAFCDKDMRWILHKDVNYLWPKTAEEKIPDTPDRPVPLFKTPKEGLPFTIKYVIGISLECLMQFEIPPATQFQFYRMLQDHADRKEYFELLASMRESDKLQIKDLLRQLGEDVESSNYNFIEEEVEDGFEGFEGFEGEHESEGVYLEVEKMDKEFESYEEEKGGEHPTMELKKYSAPWDTVTSDDLKLTGESEEISIHKKQEHSGGEEFSEYESDGENFLDESDICEGEGHFKRIIRKYGHLEMEEFLERFEKQADTGLERKKKKPRKTIFMHYLEKIGFYALDISRDMEDGAESGDDEDEKVVPKDGSEFKLKNEHMKTGDKEEPKYNERNILFVEPQRLSWEEQPQEEIGNTEELLKITVSNRPIGYQDLEHEFDQKGLTEMPSYEFFKNKRGLNVYDKSIDETCGKKMGYPLEPKGRSWEDMNKEMNTLDFGKVTMKTPGNALAVKRKSIRHDLNHEFMASKESIVISRSRKVSERRSSRRRYSREGPLIYNFPDASDYINSELPDDSYEPITSTDISELNSAEKLQRNDRIKAEFKLRLNQLNTLRGQWKNQDNTTNENDGCICYFDESHKSETSGLSGKLKEKMNQMVCLVNEYNQIMGTEEQESISFSLLKKDQGEPRKETIDGKHLDKKYTFYMPETDRSIIYYKKEWEERKELLTRIGFLELISGRKYINFTEEFDKNAEIEEKKRRMSDWFNSVIDEQIKIKESQDDRDSLNFFKSKLSSLTPETNTIYQFEKKKEHYIWIKGMVKDIIIIDQIYQIEKAMKLAGKNVGDSKNEDLLKKTIQEMSRADTNLFTDSDEDSYFDIYDSSEGSSKDSVDDGKLKIESWMSLVPKERLAIFREVTKTEREITENCKDLKSYVQKCRDNTKLYSLYRGDTPMNWKFLDQKPDESYDNYRANYITHVRETMDRLEKEHSRILDDMPDEQKDYTQFLSDL